MLQALSWTPFCLYKYHLFTQLIDYFLDVIDSRLYLLVTSIVLYIKQLIGRWWCIIPLFSLGLIIPQQLFPPSFMDRLSFLYVSTSILPYNPFQRLLPCNLHYIACQEHVFQPYTSCMVSSGKQSKSNKGPGNSPPPPRCKHYCNFICLQQQLAVAFFGKQIHSYSSVLNLSHMATIWNMSFIWSVPFSQTSHVYYLDQLFFIMRLVYYLDCVEFYRSHVLTKFLILGRALCTKYHRLEY